MSGSLEYRTDLFEGVATIERMAGHLQTLLEGIVSASAERRLSELPLLTGKERQATAGGVERHWRPIITRGTSAFTSCSEEQVRRTPDAVAVVFR